MKKPGKRKAVKKVNVPHRGIVASYIAPAELARLHAQALAEWVARSLRAKGWRVYAPHEVRLPKDWPRQIEQVKILAYDQAGVLLDTFVVDFRDSLKNSDGFKWNGVSYSMVYSSFRLGPGR